MRSVISDPDKGLVRPIFPPSAARGPQGINPSALLRMGPPMLVGSPPNQTLPTDLSDQQYSAETSSEIGGGDGSGPKAGEMMHQLVVGSQTDDGIKYAKMPPALRPERPKKVEKTKGTKSTPTQPATPMTVSC
jgi:hypothetical protein